MPYRSMVVTLAIAVALLPGEAAAAIEPERAPDDAVRRAQQHFEAEEWDEAVEALVEAYALDPKPDYLYARAQAERHRGNCKAAIALYERFLETDPSAAQVADTEVNIRRCEEELWVDRAEVAPPEPEARVEPPPPPPPEDVTPPPAATRSWARDVPGGVLLSTSLVSFAAGATVWVLGARTRRAAPDAVDEGAYESDASRGRATTAGGIALVGVGAALAGAAVIRYALVAKRRRATVDPIGGPTQAGVVLRFRF